MDLFNDHIFTYPLGQIPYWVGPEKIAKTNEAVISDKHPTDFCKDKEKFTLKLDVNRFKPDEVKVKTTENSLTISGQHEEKLHLNGYVNSSFTRKYVLPKGSDSSTLSSRLNKDGVLLVELTKKSDKPPTCDSRYKQNDDNTTSTK